MSDSSLQPSASPGDDLQSTAIALLVYLRALSPIERTVLLGLAEQWATREARAVFHESARPALRLVKCVVFPALLALMAA